MKKICQIIICTVFFFTTHAIAQSHAPAKPTSANPTDTTKQTIAQDTTKQTTDSSDDDNKRSYAIGLNYGTDQSYHGIHSNTKLPYLEPNFTYTAPSGFYTELLDQDYILGKGQKYNAFAVNPGWDIDFSDNTTLNFNVTHYFLASHPPPALISSDISNSIESYFSHYIGQTEGRLTVDYDYYKKTALIRTPNDITLTPDLNHTFKIKLGKKSSLSFIPEANVDFGTRNLYSHYAANSGSDTTLTGITVSKLSRQEKKDLILQQEQQATNNVSFGTMDYNLILSVNLKLGNFEFEPAINRTTPLYKPVGQPNTPLNYLTLNLTYTIY